jgi:phage-related protein
MLGRLWAKLARLSTFVGGGIKRMPSIGKGVREIRVKERAGAFRVIYVASIGTKIHVLHAFQKKTAKTSQRDIDLATPRFGQIRKE